MAKAKGERTVRIGQQDVEMDFGDFFNDEDLLTEDENARPAHLVENDPGGGKHSSDDIVPDEEPELELVDDEDPDPEDDDPEGEDDAEAPEGEDAEDDDTIEYVPPAVAQPAPVETDPRYLEMAQRLELAEIQSGQRDINSMKLAEQMANRELEALERDLVTAEEEGETAKKIQIMRRMRQLEDVVARAPAAIRAKEQDLGARVQRYQRGETAAQSYTAPAQQGGQQLSPQKRRGAEWAQKQKWWGREDPEAKQIQAIAIAMESQLAMTGADPMDDGYYDRLARSINNHFGKRYAVGIGGKLPAATGERRANRTKPSPVAGQRPGQGGPKKKQDGKARITPAERRFFEENFGFDLSRPEDQRAIVEARYGKGRKSRRTVGA